MAKLKARRQELVERAGAAATERAYEGDWKAFLTWCKRAGRRPVPCTSETLEIYVVSLAEQHRRLSSMKRAVTGIRAMHKRQGEEMPKLDGVRKLFFELGRSGEARRPQGKAALTVDDLAAMLERVDVSTAKGKRDRALLLIGFCGGLRRSDLAGLDVRDVVEVEQGLELRIRRGKTDQTGIGRTVPIWKGTSGLCAVRAWRAWLKARGPAPGAAFTSWRGEVATDRGITGDGIHDLVVRLAAEAGLDPKRYGSHSLRAGCVTAALASGASVPAVMALTGHQSVSTLRGYYRPGQAFDGKNPLGKAMKRR